MKRLTIFLLGLGAACSAFAGSGISGGTTGGGGISGVGGSSRSVSSQYYINVLDYGAVPDGVTTNTTAFQKAINDGSISNLPVRVPAGSYVCGSLTWPTTNVSFYGDGPTKTVIIPRGAAFGNVFGTFNTAISPELRDFCWKPMLKGGTNNFFATNATPPSSTPGIKFNADGPGKMKNVWIMGGSYGLQVTGTDSILTRPQSATFDDIFITNCTIGLITEGPNNAEYTTFGSSVQIVNCWGGWSNVTAANIKWNGGVIRDCPGFAYWQKGTTNVSYGYRGHSFIKPYWTHCGETILENANNVTFDGGAISCGGAVLGFTVSGAIRINATSNAVFNNTWIGEVSGATGNGIIFTNGGWNNRFNNIRIPIGSGTNIIGATTNNSKGWNVWSDEFNFYLRPVSTWTNQ